MKRIACLLFVALLGVAPSAFAQTAAAVVDHGPDHEALRGLLRTATEAINQRKFDAIAPHLDKGFTVITVDNQKLVGIDAFRGYWNGLFDGPGAALASVQAAPAADELTYLLGDSAGVVYGTSADTYTFHKSAAFSEGEQRTMNTRWSAAVARDGADWKIVNVHFSANLFDNPMLDAAKAGATKLALIAGLAGLVAGLILMALFKRR